MQPSDPEPQLLVDVASQEPSLPYTALAYTSEGPKPEGPDDAPITFVAIPGNPGSGRDFRYLAPHLTDRFGFVRLDPPGFGGSQRDGLNPLGISGRTKAVIVALELLNLENVVLVSHSAGGMVAAAISAQRPELINGTVLIAPPGPVAHFDQRPLKVMSRILRTPGGERLLVPVVRRVFDAQRWPKSLSDRERSLTILDAAEISFDEHAANLAAMKHPTMIAWAHDDRLIPEARFRDVERLAPEGPRLVFDTGGHNLQKTHAQEIARAMADFARA